MENAETRIFEMIYNLLSTAFSQLGIVTDALAELPLWAQELTMSAAMIFLVGIITAIVLLAIKFGKWWLAHH